MSARTPTVAGQLIASGCDREGETIGSSIRASNSAQEAALNMMRPSWRYRFPLFGLARRYMFGTEIPELHLSHGRGLGTASPLSGK